MKVYTVWWTGIPETKVDIEAESTGKAKRACMRMVLDANYECKFIDFRCRIDKGAKPTEN